MALKTRTELKAYFETDDVPTEAQYIDLIDSMFNRTDDVVAGSGYALWSLNASSDIYYNLGSGKFCGIGTTTPTAKLHIVDLASVPYVDIGYSNTLSGTGSVVIGANNVATNTYIRILGETNNATGTQAWILGNQNTVSGTNNYCFGYGNTISGDNCFIVGNSIISANSQLFAFTDHDIHVDDVIVDDCLYFYFTKTILRTSTLNLPSIPTSETGLATGDVWNDSGTLKIKT